MRPGRSGSAWRRSWASSGCSPGSIAACSPPTARRMRSGSRRCPRSSATAPWSKSPNGYPMQSPYVAVANKQVEIMVRIAAELGMTPSSRTRIRVGDKTPEDPVRGLPARPWLGRPETIRSPPMRGPWPRARSSPTAWSVWPASAISRIFLGRGSRAPASTSQAARHAIDFFGFLRHSKGEWAGQTFDARALAGLRGRLPVRLAALGRPPALPHRLLRGAAQERQEHAVGRHRPLPAGRRWRAGRRDLLCRHHPRSGANRVRRGQAHGRLVARPSSAGSAS